MKFNFLLIKKDNFIKTLKMIQKLKISK